VHQATAKTWAKVKPLGLLAVAGVLLFAFFGTILGWFTLPWAL